jgi:Uma2 family endonuclease
MGKYYLLIDIFGKLYKTTSKKKAKEIFQKFRIKEIWLVSGYNISFTRLERPPKVD